MNEVLLLVDGHAYAYRAFYAIREMHAPDGAATNAIFGFIKMFDRAVAAVKPTHLAVLWDGGLDEDRMQALPGYKAQRPEMPDELEAQLDKIVAYLDASGVHSICVDGVEADDLIASVAWRANGQGWSTVIATSDKDFMQLVSPRLRILNPGDKGQPIWDEEKVLEKTGVRPDQIVDWLSLMGDNVDNIQGVRGVGPKTATRLLREYGSVEHLYERLGDVGPERLRSSLAEARDLVLRNRALVVLKTQVAEAPELIECEPGEPDTARLKQLCESWGFRSMAQK